MKILQLVVSLSDFGGVKSGHTCGIARVWQIFTHAYACLVVTLHSQFLLFINENTNYHETKIL